MRRVGSVFLLVLLHACGGENTESAPPADAPSTAPSDWLITPDRGIGPVTVESSEVQLIATLGADRVQRRDVHIGEGFCAPGSVIDAGTSNEVEVVWEDSSRARPAAISVRGEGSDWATPAGVHVGSTLAEMEEIAGQPLTFLGFGWDYGGRGAWTFDSPEGSGRVEFDLAPDSVSAELAGTDPRYAEIAGDKEVSSDNPLIRSMTIRVERLAIRSGEPGTQFECGG